MLQNTLNITFNDQKIPYQQWCNNKSIPVSESHVNNDLPHLEYIPSMLTV